MFVTNYIKSVDTAFTRFASFLRLFCSFDVDITGGLKVPVAILASVAQLAYNMRLASARTVFVIALLVATRITHTRFAEFSSVAVKIFSAVFAVITASITVTIQAYRGILVAGVRVSVAIAFLAC